MKHDEILRQIVTEAENDPNVVGLLWLTTLAESPWSGAKRGLSPDGALTAPAPSPAPPG
jgi:hypothetical protein